MSDRGPGYIKIGGIIPLPLVDDLCVVIRDSNVATGWGEKLVMPYTREDLIKEKNENGHLALYDDQARGGIFEGLESFLADRKISFDRHSDALYDNSPEWIRFRPDTGIVHNYTTQDGEYLIGLKRVKEITKSLRAACDTQAFHTMKGLIESLEGLIRMDVKPLTEFIVLDH